MNTQDQVEVNGEYVRILGRRSEIINVGGQKVYPAEVESVILSMDNIQDVTVYGEKNQILGQIVVARVYLFDPQPLDIVRRAIRAFCKDRLANYKIPTRIEISEASLYSPRFKKQRYVHSDR